ncbi:MAG: 5'/3'-nucleotidase SurE [Gemmatimonadota bacterium]
MSLRRIRWIGACVVAVVIATPSNGVAQSGLNVLITNDDGVESPALLVLADALRGAGHRVTIVAPSANRSGSSMSITSGGQLTITEVEGAESTWHVSGTPADAVSVGLVYVLRDDPPDLVLSGPNFGQNVGANVLQSGTVGAAMTAARAGVPAIALSVEVDLREATSERRFGSTMDAFPGAAAFVVDVVRQLQESGGEGLLPPRAVLNVNYPAVGSEEPAGVRFASVSTVRGFRQTYGVNETTGAIGIQAMPGPVERAEDGSDVALLAEDIVTVSVLGGSLDMGPDAWEPLLRRLVIERVP